MADMIGAMTPILLANAITLIYCYGFWKISKWENEGRSEGFKSYRLRDLAFLIIPPLILIYGLHLFL